MIISEQTDQVTSATEHVKEAAVHLKDTVSAELETPRRAVGAAIKLLGLALFLGTVAATFAIARTALRSRNR